MTGLGSPAGVVRSGQDALEAPPARTSRAQVLVVAICGAILFGDGFDSVAMSFAAPAIAGALHLGPKDVGWLIAAAPIGAMAGAAVVAPLGDRLGRKRLIVAATLFAAVTTLLNASATTMPMILLWRFLTGVSIGVATPLAAALGSDYAPARLKRTLVTLIFCGLSLGSIASGISAGPLVHHFGWPAVFVVGGLLSLAILPFAAAFLPETAAFRIRRTAARPSTIAAVPATVLNGRARGRALLTGAVLPVTLLVWLLVATIGTVYSLISYWLPSLVTASGLPFGIAALAGAAMHFGGLAGCLLYGRLMDRFGPYRAMGGGFVIGIGAITALGLARAAAGVIVASVLVGIAIEGAIIAVNAFTAGRFPLAVRATALGWATAVARGGGVVGPLIAGLLLSLHWRPGDVLLAMTAPTGVAVLAVWLLYRLRDRPIPVALAGTGPA